MTDKLQDTSRDVEDEERDDAVIGEALRSSLFVLGGLAVLAAPVAWFLTRPEPEPEVVETKLAAVEVREASAIELPQLPFKDVTRAAGITFRHENGAYGKKLLPETMGGGCAFFDFDSDGDQDLLLVNSQRWAWDPRGPAKRPDLMALYENDGAGHFADVTAGSGLDVSFYGMGAAVADYDGDGLPDVFFSAVGSNRLFHNEGRGKFVDVTEAAGVAGDPLEWSTSCGWFDFDHDGDLDLFVCNYVKWTREFDEVQNFQLTGGGEAYGRPQNFEGTFPYLYRNDGGGKFTEVADEAGLHIKNPATGVALAKSLGVTFADFDRDGWLDVIVANDTVQNLMFHNLQNGRFEEMGAIVGVAFDMNGAARGAMGIDAATFRNNDAVGIAIGNFSNEMTALYVSSGRQMQFMDESVSTGLGPNTRLELTFGVLYVDCDLDGRLDLFCSNGHLEEDINRVQPSQHYQQPQQLFWNCGAEQDTEFIPVPEEKCGRDLLQPMVGRGAACADIDNDGDQDLLVTSVGRGPRLLRNDQQLRHHWLKFKLVGKGANRDAIGAEIEVRLPDQTLRRRVMPTRSYISQSELPVIFGLGDNTTVESVTVTWPDGSTQKVSDVATDRLTVIRQHVE
ncbi:CRTAC1 family protein [bacterium]|nr:CRTAC1 family protein [bacterium]